MADPTLTRNLTLPLVKALLLALGEPKLAHVLERLGTIFGVYGEWGQPIHDVGNDVRLLGLPIRRPTPSPPSGCCAATTGTCRSSAGCGTRTRSPAASGCGRTRSTRSSTRRDGRWRRCGPRSSAGLMGERLDLRSFRPR
jgi:hypothetical protein